MKIILNREKKVIFLIVLVVVAVVVSLLVLNIKQRGNHKKIYRQYEEMVSLSNEYLKLKGEIGGIEKRIGLEQSQNISIVFENLMSGMGLREKVQSVKPFGGGVEGEYTIQEAEITIDNITLNELVNIFYALYTAPAGLFVTSTELKRDFSEQTLIDVRMSLKLVGLKGEAS